MLLKKPGVLLQQVLFAAIVLASALFNAGSARFVYVLPAFVQYGGGGCLDDARRNGYHADYVWPLRWVKWKYTVLCGLGPPTQDFGNQDFHNDFGEAGHRSAPKPIPPASQWQISHVVARTKLWPVVLVYKSATTKDNYNVRDGWRWDDIDGFYTYSVSIKHIPYQWDVYYWHWQQHRFWG